MFTYQTSIPQTGLGQQPQQRIDRLRNAPGPSLDAALFSAPVYQRQRMMPQQQAGMERQLGDTFRAEAWQQANQLQRQYDQANEPLRMQQMQAASSAMHGFGNVLADALWGRQNNLMQGFNLLAPLMG